MTQEYYNAYSHYLSQTDVEVEMPTICGGYTLADWLILEGELVDREYLDDYLDDPTERYNYIVRITKPYWA